MKIFEKTDTGFKGTLPYETGVSLSYLSDEEFEAFASTYETHIKKDGYTLKKYVSTPMDAIIDILMIRKEEFNEPDHIAMRRYLWVELGKLIADGNEDAIKTAVRWGTDVLEHIKNATDIVDRYGDNVAMPFLPFQGVTTMRRRYSVHPHAKGYYFGEMFKYNQVKPVIEAPEPVPVEEFVPYKETPYVFTPARTKDEIDTDELESACQSYIRSVIPVMKNLSRNFEDMEFNPMEMMRVKYHDQIADTLGISRSEKTLKDILHNLETSIKLPVRDYDNDTSREITFYAFEYGGKLTDLLLQKLTKK